MRRMSLLICGIILVAAVPFVSADDQVSVRERVMQKQMTSAKKQQLRKGSTKIKVVHPS